jgi:hypothetical protein
VDAGLELLGELCELGESVREAEKFSSDEDGEEKTHDPSQADGPRQPQRDVAEALGRTGIGRKGHARYVIYNDSLCQ